MWGLSCATKFFYKQFPRAQGEIAPDCVLVNGTEWCPVESNVWMMCANGTAATLGAALCLIIHSTPAQVANCFPAACLRAAGSQLAAP